MRKLSVVNLSQYNNEAMFNCVFEVEARLMSTMIKAQLADENTVKLFMPETECLWMAL
jgi:hypothetical protein